MILGHGTVIREGRPRGDANRPCEAPGGTRRVGRGDGAGQSAPDGSFVLFVFAYLLVQPWKQGHGAWKGVKTAMLLGWFMSKD